MVFSLKSVRKLTVISFGNEQEIDVVIRKIIKRNYIRTLNRIYNVSREKRKLSSNYKMMNLLRVNPEWTI